MKMMGPFLELIGGKLKTLSGNFWTDFCSSLYYTSAVVEKIDILS